MLPKITTAQFLRAITRFDQAPAPPRPAVAFAGRSNVGKSSLINRLVGRKGLARTSNTPGRTQEIIYFDIDERFYFVDLPGYGYAKVSQAVHRRWGPMIENFLLEAEELRLVVVILDVRRTPTPQDLQLLAWLDSRAVPYIFAVTKCDKIGYGEQKKRLVQIQKDLGLENDESLVPVSSQTGKGMEGLWGVIFQAVK